VQEWVSRLRAAGVPVAPVRSLDRVYDDPQVSANQLIETLEVPGVGEVRQLGAVFKVDGIVPRSTRPAPELGQHNRELLREPRARVS